MIEAMPENPASPVSAKTAPEMARVRRAPKYGVFAALGVAAGIVAALILSSVFSGTSDPSPFTQVTYSQSQTFGFILLWCVPAGVLLGMLVALVLDWTVGRSTREVRVAHDVVDES
jgi:hypothetical protein